MNFNATRRRLLMGLAAASTAALPGAAKAAQRPPECPELIALGETLPDLASTFTDARQEAERIAAETSKVWPLAPEEIVGFYCTGRRETDVTGAGISRSIKGRGNYEQVWEYGTPETFEAQAAAERAKIARIEKTKSKRGLKTAVTWLARYEAALPLSRAYCAEIDRLTRESGYPAAAERRDKARETLRAHITATMQATPRTMEGVLIQAQALSAWGSVEPLYQGLNPDAQTWAGALAGNIMAQAESA